MKDSDRTFAGIPQEYSNRHTAKIYLQSIAYDGTSSWGKGADQGYEAFLDAADNMELYDIETDSEVYREGIYLLPTAPSFDSPESMFAYTYAQCKKLLMEDRFLTFFGGEHSISIGLIRAFYEHFSDLTIVQIDAHADLRSTYEGSPYNHACALFDASQHANLIQIGIRSMDVEETKVMQKDQVYFAHELDTSFAWLDKAISQMSSKVYITFDLDALDPSIMPATGTPEPGGLDWYQTLHILRRIFEGRDVVGFDIVELAPMHYMQHPQFLAAKLYYKMLSYKFMDR